MAAERLGLEFTLRPRGRPRKKAKKQHLPFLPLEPQKMFLTTDKSATPLVGVLVQGLDAWRSAGVACRTGIRRPQRA
jgi:hypothetical protein